MEKRGGTVRHVVGRRRGMQPDVKNSSLCSSAMVGLWAGSACSILLMRAEAAGLTCCRGGKLVMYKQTNKNNNYILGRPFSHLTQGMVQLFFLMRLQVSFKQEVSNGGLPTNKVYLREQTQAGVIALTHLKKKKTCVSGCRLTICTQVTRHPLHNCGLFYKALQELCSWAFRTKSSFVRHQTQSQLPNQSHLEEGKKKKTLSLTNESKD